MLKAGWRVALKVAVFAVIPAVISTSYMGQTHATTIARSPDHLQVEHADEQAA
jgi:hypothetical protein